MNSKSLEKKNVHEKTELDEAAQLIEQMKTVVDLRERIEKISGHFIGRPYFSNPLGGGPGEQESLSTSLEGFDCVTYIEAVLALALSKNIEEFTSILSMIRYSRGRVEWLRRNHYMVDWMKENQARGFIVDITKGAGAIEKTRLLNVVGGLSAKKALFFCYPKRKWKSIADKIESGDIVFFASVKKHLDVFHAGLLIRRDDGILLRHATRKRGSVIEQKIEEFLADHRMSGLILARPKERKSKQ